MYSHLRQLHQFNVVEFLSVIYCSSLADAYHIGSPATLIIAELHGFILIVDLCRFLRGTIRRP